MMELTRKGEYAIRGVVYLAKLKPGEVALISEIAENTGVPQTFLAKILQSFAKIGIVNSFRGTGGGFVLGRPASQITLREVVEAVEGPIMPNRCLIEDAGCEFSNACLVHPVWREVQSKVVDVLNGVTIESLAKDKY